MVMTEEQIRADERELSAARIEEAILYVMASPDTDDTGSKLVAGVLARAAELVRLGPIQ